MGGLSGVWAAARLALGLLCVLLRAAHSVELHGDAGLAVTVDPHTGAYAVTTPAGLRLGGLAYNVRFNGSCYSTSNRTLALLNLSSSVGQDGMGNYSSTRLSWRLAGTPIRYATSFRVYGSAVIFGQQFEDGLVGAAGGSFVAEFPALAWDDRNPSAGYVSWNGGMSGDDIKSGRWPTSDGFGAQDGGPVVVFPEGPQEWTMVVSEASRFMTGGVGACAESAVALCSGLRGAYDAIPAGFSFETILSLSAQRGVAAGMLDWGSALLSKYGKSRVMPWLAESDFITKLGYSSTGWFHYCPDPVAGQYDPDHGNYEEPLVRTHELLVDQGVPYHYGWIDSWWYGERLHKGVALWEDSVTNPPQFDDMKTRFPTGLTGMTTKTGKRVVAHIGEWNSASPYAANSSNQFIDRGSHTLPVSAGFWRELMGKAKDWGLLVMKQDHINENIEGYQNNVTVLSDWLAAQAQASYDNGIPIMYCMDQPWFLTNALQLPLSGHPTREVLTRASGDYLPGDNRGQWAVGGSAILAWSLSVFPYKDTFYSNTSEVNSQKGCPFYGFKEQYPVTHAIAATLSAGPVAFSDGPGSTNKSLVMQTCRADGTLLKPDRPAMSIESTWSRKAFNASGPSGEAWATHVSIPGCGGMDPATWHYVFANKLSEDYELTAADLFAPFNGSKLLGWEYGAKTTVPFGANSPIVLRKGDDYGDWRLWRLSPMLGGWSLVGEPNKFVGVARQRFACIGLGLLGTGLLAELMGAPGEQVEILLADSKAQLVGVKCVLSSAGKAILTATATGKVTCA